MSVIRLEHLKKNFGDLEVLKDISLEIKKGEVAVQSVSEKGFSQAASSGLRK